MGESSLYLLCSQSGIHDIDVDVEFIRWNQGGNHDLVSGLLPIQAGIPWMTPGFRQRAHHEEKVKLFMCENVVFPFRNWTNM